MIRKCAIPSTAGATKAKKSEGVIQEGTARTASITPSVSTGREDATASKSVKEGLFSEPRNTWTVPSGKLVVPTFLRVCGTNVASACPVVALMYKAR
jgi:hypothetical protein